MKRLAIITTHPIQYYAPFFRLLAAFEELSIKVFYTLGEKEVAFDRGFGRQIRWDIPLLEGYEYTFLKNTAQSPGSHHFQGVANPDLVKEVNQWKADAVLVFGWCYQSHLSALRYFKGKIPVYFRGDSHLLDEQPGLKKNLRRLALKWVYRHIDYAFYVGTANKRYFLSHGLKEAQLIFAPHAVDNQRFADDDEQYARQAKEWRLQLGIPEGQIVILFAGKFESKKNPLLLLQAAKHFSKSARFSFVFAGNGPLEEPLKEEAQGLVNVHFIDFQNQSYMPALYRLGDIFVLPSQGPGETWGLAVNEAMACSRPVLVSDKVGCAVDLVAEGCNGFVFSHDSVTDLTEKIKLVSNDITTMGAKSYRMIQDWCFEKQRAAFTDLINDSVNA